MSEGPKLVITEIRRDLLIYFKECKEDDSYEHFDGLYSESALQEAFKWLFQKRFLSTCGSGLRFKLSERGLEVLNEIEQKVQEKQESEVRLTEKEASSKFFDRLIDNTYKLVGIPILVWTVILQYNQAGNSADIRILQEKLRADSTQFSTTVRALENQLIQLDKKPQADSIQNPVNSSKSP